MRRQSQRPPEKFLRETKEISEKEFTRKIAFRRLWLTSGNPTASGISTCWVSCLDTHLRKDIHF